MIFLKFFLNIRKRMTYKTSTASVLRSENCMRENLLGLRTCPVDFIQHLGVASHPQTNQMGVYSFYYYYYFYFLNIYVNF